jgi:lysine 2,3-aminomutase
VTPDLARWIASSRRSRAWHDWRWQVRHALDDRALARHGLLPPAARAAGRAWPARVTPYFLSLSCGPDRSGPCGPLLAQWLPAAAELAGTGRADPFDEARRAPAPGVVQRFPDRVLVRVSRVCAVQCRHCTRRHTLLRTAVAGVRDLPALLAFLRARPAVREAILSGGDPLLLADAALLRLVRALAALPQLDAIRIGTRAPVTLPMRVTPALARGLSACRRVWVNTQFNHVREITPESAAACGRLVDAGIPVSNQAVLLRGVNDSVDAMVALCAGLQRIRVRPYYVFVCDPVAGTAHLRVGRRRARAIAAGVAARLGGLAVPRFVLDVPGAPGKVAV